MGRRLLLPAACAGSTSESTPGTATGGSRLPRSACLRSRAAAPHSACRPSICTADALVRHHGSALRWDRAARYTALGEWGLAWKYHPLGIVTVLAVAVLVLRATFGVLTRHRLAVDITWTNRGSTVRPVLRRVSAGQDVVTLEVREIPGVQAVDVALDPPSVVLPGLICHRRIRALHRSRGSQVRGRPADPTP